MESLKEFVKKNTILEYCLVIFGLPIGFSEIVTAPMLNNSTNQLGGIITIPKIIPSILLIFGLVTIGLSIYGLFAKKIQDQQRRKKMGIIFIISMVAMLLISFFLIVFTVINPIYNIPSLN